MVAPIVIPLINNATHVEKAEDKKKEIKEELKQINEAPKVSPGIQEIIKRRVKLVENYRDRINLIMQSPINLSEVKEVMF